MSYYHFHHFNNLNDSDYSFLWLFAVVPDEPPSPEQQALAALHCLIRHGSSSTNRHRCRTGTRCAGRLLMPAAPRRATLSTVTAIAVITAARRSRRSNGRDNSHGNGGHIDNGDHGGHCGPSRCRGRGRPCGTAWHCQPPRARRSAAAGPPVAAGPSDGRTTSRRRLASGGRRWPAGLPGSACRQSAAGGRRGSKRRSPLMRPDSEPDDRASQCCRRPFTTMPFTNDGKSQTPARW